jgi:RsiW-degrading membrane proteinase PrsW (M82 family)
LRDWRLLFSAELRCVSLSETFNPLLPIASTDTYLAGVYVSPEECVIPIHKPKTTELLFFFSCGIIMSIPITILTASLANSLIAGLDTFLAALLSTAIFAPLIEEFSKIFPLYYRHGETQRSILHLAIMVGLGFAIVELLEYVFLLGTPVVYRLPGLFFHPSSTAIAAYGIATKRPLVFYLLAVSLHFANNFLAIVNPFPFSASIFIVGLTVWLAWRFYSKTAEKLIM